MSLSYTKQPPLINLTGDEIWVEVQSTAIATTSHSIVLDCYKDTDTLITTLEAPVISGKALFNIQEVYKKDFDKFLTIPETDLIKIKDIVIKSFVIAIDKVDGVTDEINTLESDLFYCIQGGISRKKQAYYAETGNSFCNDFFVTGKKFLTFSPVYKVVTHYSPELLYFYALASQTVTYAIKIYFTDNTTSDHTLSSINATEHKIYQLQCGFEKLALSVYETENKKITKYEIYIKDNQSTEITERKTYILDGRFFNNSKKVFYKNTLGVYEVAELNAKMILRSEIGRQTSIRNYIERINTVSVTNKVEVSTVWIDKFWRLHLQYLLASREAFEYRNEYLYEIVPLNDKETLLDTDSFMYLCTLEYKYASIGSEPLFMDVEDAPTNPTNYLNLPTYSGYIQYLADGILYIENGKVKSTTIINLDV